MSTGHFVQYEHGRKEPGAWFIYPRRDTREDLRVHCPYRLPELQSQKIQTTFLLHTPVKVVVKAVTTGTAEGSEQEDRLKAALCRIWDTKCNQRLAILFPSSNEVSQVQQIGREPGWLQDYSSGGVTIARHGPKSGHPTESSTEGGQRGIRSLWNTSSHAPQSQATTLTGVKWHTATDHRKTYPLGPLSLASTFHKPLSFFFLNHVFHL